MGELAGKKLHCVQCGKELTGRQTKFCCNRCKKAWQEKQKRIGAVDVQPKADAPPPFSVPSVAKAAGTEDQRQALVALRQKLAVEIDMSESARDLGTLSARFLETLERIQVIDDKRSESKGGGALDEFTKRREARRAPAA